MEMYRNGLIDVECMLTRYYSLEQINEAFYDAEHGAVKNVIVIGGTGGLMANRKLLTLAVE